MVKPKNKHSLSHVRHDPAHCLAPGLFRALKRGERKRSKLDVTYDYGATASGSSSRGRSRWGPMICAFCKGWSPWPGLMA